MRWCDIFAKAYEIASHFTDPVVTSVRFFDGRVTCSVGTFVAVNPEGWVFTAAHIMIPLLQSQEHGKKIASYIEQKSKIEGDNTLSNPQRKKQIAKLVSNPNWITHISYWWGNDTTKQVELRLNAKIDLALVRLDPVKEIEVTQYPVIKRPLTLAIGTSLCKLGFPFHEIKASFDEKSGAFSLEEGAVPIPRFPIEGIYTRNVILGITDDKKYEIKFLETSSPGLRGQSGGPIFDQDGTVWAIQSRTQHLNLGFNPKVTKGKVTVEENQFLNVGWGVHPEILVQFLDDNSIQYKVSEK